VQQEQMAKRFSKPSLQPQMLKDASRDAFGRKKMRRALHGQQIQVWQKLS
jgi:hypothetical protein